MWKKSLIYSASIPGQNDIAERRNKNSEYGQKHDDMCHLPKFLWYEATTAYILDRVPPQVRSLNPLLNYGLVEYKI